MRLIQKIGIDPDDTIWKTQIKVDLGDFIPQRKCRDAICDISKFLSSPLFKLFVHNYHLQSDLVLSLPQLKRIIWDFWGQLQSGSDLYFITALCLVGSLLSDKPVKFHVMKERRSGGTRAYAGTDGRSTMTGTEAVGINVGQPIQHALFGRVKVVRDERRRCLTFQTAIANPMTKVASYDEGVQWVPFTINSETLARPFVHSAIGQRILLERRNDITHLLQADPVNTVTSSALVVSNSTAVSAGNNEEAEVEHTMGEGPDVMKVDEHNEGFNAAVRAIPMQTNPLFVNKIVMASSGFQNRQPK
ncbi:hypothetical protein P8452_65872 [Trifolium repens]|nr:hypothetical protein P8452_65872 [Trifolium repens]